MSSRIIRSFGGSHVLRDYLVSLFVAEAMNPSKELYLISPFLSNSPLIENKHNQYTDVFPLIKSKTIYLSDILTTFAWKGMSVRIICDNEREETKPLIHALRDHVEFRKLEQNHDKGLVTSNVYIHGSMNFTYSGIYLNKESLRTTNVSSDINEAIIAFRQRWEESEKI
ncbi:phospholipase D-like domain-containing protein DpdK [Cytobacillus firmus]|uniref:phospholipase D-like domain-containing protein DpdK n=1 Tax=Cytobacillus firmus TaxID=1399 RepID=UPI0021624C9A|nr:phospholipase D-like domain-containing protein DpdK [Cytobacillus firmus]MCS0674472.1 phospholipase D-like domain-containing protein DpdK [Cytobacillus firmus]